MTNPLDMADTLKFYRENTELIKLALRLAKSSGSNQDRWTYSNFYGRNHRIFDPGNHASVPNDGIYAIINSLPENARWRAMLSGFYFLPDLWFEKRDDNLQVPTADVKRAISPTSIIPSHTGGPDSDTYFSNLFPDYAYPEGRHNRIRLFGLKKSIEAGILDGLTAEIVHAEGLVHEYVHALNALGIREESNKNFLLHFPDKTTLSPLEALLKFGELMESSSPISHYSSFFWKPSRGGGMQVEDGNGLKAIDEELAESGAAYVLGFTFSPELKGNLRPFDDREEIFEFMKQYLGAKLVATQIKKLT